MVLENARDVSGWWEKQLIPRCEKYTTDVLLKY